MRLPIYLDNQSTTRVDPIVSESMRVFEDELYANPGSTAHVAGRRVAEEVSRSLAIIANDLGCDQQELVITSGATESNNLALFGFCLHPRQKRRVIVSAASEHRAILDPMLRLQSQGFDVRMLPIHPYNSPLCGQVDLDAAAKLIDESVAIVTIMLANNEIGIIQPIAELAKLCRLSGAILHTDGTQALGHSDISVDQLDVDLLSFSAHKFHGPKGIGGLFVRDRMRRIPLRPQIVGGGQQANRRSGTLNSVGIVGMAKALELTRIRASTDRTNTRRLRDRLWSRLREKFDGLELNGPALDSGIRLDRNLNCRWQTIEGQSLMLECPDLCVSSGSACTSADPRPSHVLEAIGLTEEQSRCSIRFGLSRFTTDEEIEASVEMLGQAHKKLSQL
jgi:cysteine desulfurase